ncbi:MAG: hypothetical protein QNI89_08150 [Desulfobacterales bacterium]|nr:hypothetical protein [Desulfobacterales bacterium]
MDFIADTLACIGRGQRSNLVSTPYLPPTEVLQALTILMVNNKKILTPAIILMLRVMHGQPRPGFFFALPGVDATSGNTQSIGRATAGGSIF